MGERLFRLKEPVWELRHDYEHEGVEYKTWVWTNCGPLDYRVGYQSVAVWPATPWQFGEVSSEIDGWTANCDSLEEGQSACVWDFLERMANVLEEVECE